MQINIADLITKDLKMCHEAAVDGGWWNDLTTGESMVGKRDYIQLCALIMTEVLEAYEGGSQPDDKLPHRRAFEVELADAMIRSGDTAFGCGLDLLPYFQEFEERDDMPEDMFDAPMPRNFDICCADDRALATGVINLHICKSIEGYRKRDLEKQQRNLALAIGAIMYIGVNFRLDVRGAMIEKIAYNAHREDHKIENRRKEGGKKE